MSDIFPGFGQAVPGKAPTSKWLIKEEEREGVLCCRSNQSTEDKRNSEALVRSAS